MDKTPVLFYEEGTCSLGALISLIWLNEPFYLCRLEENDNENPDYLTLNALGQVPLLYTDGTVLTENVAILQHLAMRGTKQGLAFKPGTPEFDQFNRALGFLTSDFHKSFFPIFAVESLSHDPKTQEEIKTNTIEGHLREVFQHANDHLLRTTFLFDHPTPIDAYLFAMARWGDNFYDIEKEFPHIKRFQNAMMKNEEVQFALEIESGKQKGSQGSFLGHKEFKSFVKAAAERKLAMDQQKGDGDFTPGLKAESTSKVSREPIYGKKTS
jgi:glutathione S-transferase